MSVTCVIMGTRAGGGVVDVELDAEPGASREEVGRRDTRCGAPMHRPMHRPMTRPEYPPSHHVLSDLGIAIEAHPDGTARASLPVTPKVTSRSGGVRTGVVATLVDVLGGAIGMQVLSPDWMATADLALQLVRSPVGTEVTAEGSVVRRGRTTLVVECAIADGGQGPAGWATLSFAILPHDPELQPFERDESASSSRVTRFGTGEGTVPVLEVLGLGVDGDGSGLGHGVAGDATPGSGDVRLEISDYVRNSFGAVQGGVMAFVAEEAGARAVRSAASEVTGEASPDLVTADLHVVYLSTARHGPVVAEVDVGPVDTSGGSATVELFDRGAGGRRAVVAEMTVVALGGGAPDVGDRLQP